MILRPWPMILRSLPITDLGPPRCARTLGGGCCRAAGGIAIAFGWLERLRLGQVLRVNIKSPVDFRST